MNLHEEKELFWQIINSTARKLGIYNAIIEKDYFVTLFLKNLVVKEPRIIFKGGTSLSKCYKLIQRFSEDIDLSYDNGDNHLTEGMRRNFSKLVKETGDSLHLDLVNTETIRSRRDFNRYDFFYQSLGDTGSIASRVIVETAIAIRSFPTELLKMNSFIFEYLISEGFEDVISDYDLYPFNVTVQTKERTFVDKVFALCDYYLSDNIAEHSRHLYDLHKLFPYIIFDDNFSLLIHDVRNVRSLSKVCFSAYPECNISKLLGEILSKDVYYNDFLNITQPLLFESIDYNSVKNTLSQIQMLQIF